jgi:hypothetical protein
VTLPDTGPAGDLPLALPPAPAPVLALTPLPGDEGAATVADPEALPVDRVALARLYGEPLFRLPTDLYIPPDALEVFLEAFEGPLDLLLYLIRRQNFNILDIPLADVTRQYLAYVDQIRLHNLELASEYLLMAAMLIEIKSRMLASTAPCPAAWSGSRRSRPASRALHVVGMALALTAIHAACAQRRVGAQPRSTSKPSMPGSWMSSSTRSGRACAPSPGPVGQRGQCQLHGRAVRQHALHQQPG